MIKNGIKNYFRNLKYLFTPLGTIALGMVLGLSAAIPAVKNAVYGMFVSIKELTDNSSVEFNEFFKLFWIQIKDLDWTSPMEAIEMMLDKEWLTEALNNSILATMSVEIMQVEDIVNECLMNIGAAFAVFVMFGIIGFFCGYFVTKWLIRREIARRSIWKYFMISFIDSLLSATLVTFSLWILTQWKVGVIISSLASILLFGFIELFEAYLSHAWKKVDVKQIISVKNIAKLFCSNIIIFLISAVFVLLAIAISNALTGLFVGIAIVEIAFIVIGLNAEAYVKSVAEKAQETQSQDTKVIADKKILKVEQGKTEEASSAANKKVVCDEIKPSEKLPSAVKDIAVDEAKEQKTKTLQSTSAEVAATAVDDVAKKTVKKPRKNKSSQDSSNKSSKAADKGAENKN